MTAPHPVHEKAIDSSILRDIEGARFESWDPEKILTWALENFHPRLSLSCSFGAPEGLVLLDMMHRIEPSARVFVLDTGRIPQATYDLMDRVRDRYGKSLEVVFPRAESVEAMVRESGLNLFYESIEKRQLCCRVRKVEVDLAHGGIVKINPLADWEAEDVWHYVRQNDVPTNRLHKEGYPSVGCDPCSRAVEAGDDPRAGRWWWENAETKECGIHVGEESGGSGI